MIDLKLLVILWDITTLIGSLLSGWAVKLSYGDFKAADIQVRKMIARNRLRSELTKFWLMLSFLFVGVSIFLAGISEGKANYVALVLFIGVFCMMIDTALWLYNRKEIYRGLDAVERIAGDQDRREKRQTARGEHQDERQIHQDVREVHQDSRQIRQDERDIKHGL